MVKGVEDGFPRWGLLLATSLTLLYPSVSFSSHSYSFPLNPWTAHFQIHCLEGAFTFLQISPLFGPPGLMWLYLFIIPKPQLDHTTHYIHDSNMLHITYFILQKHESKVVLCSCHPAVCPLINASQQYDPLQMSLYQSTTPSGSSSLEGLC